MKQFAILTSLLILLTMCFAGSACALHYQSKQIYNCEEYVSMYKGSNVTADEVCRVSVGEVVMASDYNAGFCYCCYNDQYGYILKRYLNTEVAPYSEGRYRIANCSEWVSLRPMPDADVEAQIQVPLGETLDKVFYHDMSEDWSEDGFAYVCYNGNCGFVKWNYLERVDAQ